MNAANNLKGDIEKPFQVYVNILNTIFNLLGPCVVLFILNLLTYLGLKKSQAEAKELGISVASSGNVVDK